MDSWYNLRQIEQVITNFPSYAWFDPMTGYPTGKVIEWGPVFTLLCSFFCIAAGAHTQTDIIRIVSFVPPFLSLIMVPLLYGTGSVLNGRKSGFIAAILISLMGGGYLHRSLYGYVDHHILEAVLSTAFLLLYCLGLNRDFDKNFCLYNNFKKILPCGLGLGFVYYIGIMTVPTMVLISMIVAIFALLYALLNPDSFVIQKIFLINIVLYSTFIIFFVLFGVHQSGFGLNGYTLAHLVVSVLIIGISFLLFSVSHVFRGGPFWKIPIIILGSGMIFLITLFVFIPDLFNQFLDNASTFLFLSYEKTSISEMQGWDFSAAFSSYNLALFLFIAGFFLSLSRVYHTGDKVRFFLITWTIVILTSTLLHVRYEYLAVVPVVILASIALASLHTWTKKRIHQSVFCFFGITSGSVNRRVPCMIETHGATILIGILLLVIALLTVSNTLGEINSTVRDLSISDDWVDALEWFQTNTPDSGIDFYAIYEMNNFTYPNTSYGILSWWMYGHWISVISHRIPLASPFQNTVYRVAPFFLSTTEADANNLADEYGIKYVITDFSLTESQFSSLPFWTNGMYQIDRFQFTYSPGNSQSSKAKVVSFKKNDFYQDMIFRLHELDGSFFSGVGGMVVHYDRIENESYSRLINTSIVTALEANLLARKGLPVGQDLVSTKYSLPVCDVPALQTYRLIYESPQTVTVSRNSEVKWVKIFERVPGYVIEGDGTIELPLITNQGRKFVYQQKSENGRFIVPYSTTAAKNRVSATGPYHILETGETFAIPELAI